MHCTPFFRLRTMYLMAKNRIAAMTMTAMMVGQSIPFPFHYPNDFSISRFTQVHGANRTVHLSFASQSKSAN